MRRTAQSGRVLCSQRARMFLSVADHSSAYPVILSRVNCRWEIQFVSSELVPGRCGLLQNPPYPRQDGSAELAKQGREPPLGIAKGAFSVKAGSAERSDPLPRCLRAPPGEGRHSEASATTMRPGWLARAAFVFRLSPLGSRFSPLASRPVALATSILQPICFPSAAPAPARVLSLPRPEVSIQAP